MLRFEVQEKERISSVGSYDGVQEKWLSGTVWLKADRLGYEGLAETLSSLVLSCTDIPFVAYNTCTIVERGHSFRGCCCPSFISSSMLEITLATIVKQRYYSVENYHRLSSVWSVQQRMCSLCQIVYDYTGRDFSDALARLLLFDCLVKNTDRHLSNISFLQQADGTFSLAPVFDNGAALASTVKERPKDLGTLRPKTIVGSFDIQARELLALGADKIRLDYTRLNSLLRKFQSEDCPDRVISRAKGILRQSLRETKGWLWVL